MLTFDDEVLKNKDGEFIVRFFEALLSGVEFSDINVYEDDHIDCCEFSFKGKSVEFMWCGPEVVGAITFNDSVRAQKLLTDHVLCEVVEGDSSLYESATDLLETYPKMLGFDDFFSVDHARRLFALLLRFETEEELLTSSDEWTRDFAKRCIELKQSS